MTELLHESLDINTLPAYGMQISFLEKEINHFYELKSELGEIISSIAISKVLFIGSGIFATAVTYCLINAHISPLDFMYLTIPSYCAPIIFGAALEQQVEEKESLTLKLHAYEDLKLLEELN